MFAEYHVNTKIITTMAISGQLRPRACEEVAVKRLIYFSQIVLLVDPRTGVLAPLLYSRRKNAYHKNDYRKSAG